MTAPSEVREEPAVVTDPVCGPWRLANCRCHWSRVVTIQVLRPSSASFAAPARGLRAAAAATKVARAAVAATARPVRAEESAKAAEKSGIAAAATATCAAAAAAAAHGRQTPPAPVVRLQTPPRCVNSDECAVGLPPTSGTAVPGLFARRGLQRSRRRGRGSRRTAGGGAAGASSRCEAATGRGGGDRRGAACRARCAERWEPPGNVADVQSANRERATPPQHPPSELIRL
jgi:hypothetical protein